MYETISQRRQRYPAFFGNYGVNLTFKKTWYENKQNHASPKMPKHIQRIQLRKINLLQHPPLSRGQQNIQDIAR